ncbi:MAG TPA: diacylglycerol kinase family protein [Conexivisphaerales archaeon]|nr:diacylglycerol kinase family protein [Conexivisphaerales archaeon]
MTKSFFVVNPAAANGRVKADWENVLRAIKSSYSASVDFEFTPSAGTGSSLSRRALKEGYDVVVSVGGDGTLNEVVNGFFEGGKPINPDASLGVLSLGTGSDFVKTLGIERSLSSYLATLKKGKTKMVDSVRSVVAGPRGSKETRYFINVAECGSGGAVVDKVNRTTKAFGGRISFLWGILTTLPTYKNHTVTFSVDSGPEVTSVLNDFVVANGRFFGGGLKPAPQAELDDGILDVVTIGDLRFREVVFNLRKLTEGTHLSNPKVTLTKGRRVAVRSEERTLVEEDGEIVGFLPAQFEIVPKSVSLIC